MGISNIFGNSFDLVKNNLKIGVPAFAFTLLITVISLIIFGGALIGGGSLSAISAVMHGTASPAAILPLLVSFSIAFGIIVVIAALIGIFLAGMYVAVAEQGWKKQTIRLWGAFDVTKVRYASLLGAGLVFAIIEIIVLAVLGFVGLSVYLVHSPVLDVVAAVLLGIIGIIACIIIDIFAYQAYTVVILEKLKAIAAVKRSISIGKSLWGSILAVLIVIILISIGASLVISLIAVVIDLIPVIGVFVASIINFILSALLQAWIMIIPVYFYHEYVSRKRLR